MALSSHSSKSLKGQIEPTAGFLIISRPYTTDFQAIGPYHQLSYLSPVGQWTPVTTGKLNICVWLGPDRLTIDVPDVTVFFIWPEKKIILPISILNFTNPSDFTVVDLDSPKTDSTISSKTSTIFHELLHINTLPCLLFLSQNKGVNMDTIFKESSTLSFAAYARKTVVECMEFFERHIIEGDAINSETLRQWFAVTSRAMNDHNPADFLFDPTLLLVGVINHIRATIIDNHTFDIQGKKSIAIPFTFIRGWFDILKALLDGPEKDNTVKHLLDLGRGDNR